jgi:hypothetical protein
MLQKVKTIASYSGLARWLSTVKETGEYLTRYQVRHIPSPYRYSPTVEVVAWKNKQVVWFETSHRRYEVYAVPADMVKFKSEKEAEDYHIRLMKQDEIDKNS